MEERRHVPVDEGWRSVSIGLGERADRRRGVDLWTVRWKSTHGRIVVAHPSYPQERHIMYTYEVEGTDPPLTFAAGESSNGVRGFIVPTRGRLREAGEEIVQR